MTTAHPLDIILHSIELIHTFTFLSFVLCLVTLKAEDASSTAMGQQVMGRDMDVKHPIERWMEAFGKPPILFHSHIPCLLACILTTAPEDHTLVKDTSSTGHGHQGIVGKQATQERERHPII